ncbi:uncharacterized protein LOC107459466 [Arachis duranensis]|uniref:Uncharacterized protein LOC107459466 n=1 Tax=Arachis duranensis TaxID=130453 RepID=A0A6P4BNS6_ARADU|nr:uncharacterized protein LOC107459466 [Arachis duranensis]
MFFVRKVQNEIHNEIGNAKFCLIVDEARDESKREQMELVIRFVDKHGFVKERLIDVVHVKDITSATLKQEICSALSHHNLNIQNVRGQATTSVLEDLATNGSTCSQRDDATYTLKSLLSFDFIFILHMMKEIMGITDKLCQALQQKSQDILNAMHLIPDMGASFSDIIRSRRKKDVVTIEHHYRVDIFTSVIDFQLKELNSRFSEQATELLILSTSLDPKGVFKLFSVCNIWLLAKNFIL